MWTQQKNKALVEGMYPSMAVISRHGKNKQTNKMT